MLPARGADLRRSIERCIQLGLPALQEERKSDCKSSSCYLALVRTHGRRTAPGRLRRTTLQIQTHKPCSKADFTPSGSHRQNSGARSREPTILRQAPCTTWDGEFLDFLTELHLMMDDTHPRFYHPPDTIVGGLANAGIARADPVYVNDDSPFIRGALRMSPRIL